MLPGESFASVIFGANRALVPIPARSAGSLCISTISGRLYASLGTLISVQPGDTLTLQG